MLIVKPSGSRSWIFRYQLNKRRRDMGLGPYPGVSLARARELANEARTLTAERKDPLVERRRPDRLTFEAAAEALIGSKRSGWRSPKHADQWRSTLAQHAFPKIGGLDVADVDTTAVLAVLRPIWTRIPETASRVRQRVEAVLSYAAVTGARSGDNPARWRGHLDQLLPKPSKVRAVEHFAALPWQDMPTFWPTLCAQDGVAALALRFAILTAARSGEGRGMTWDEVDLDTALWIVPASRMKAAKEHRVPLSKPALSLLAELPRISSVVFPNTRGKPLSDMALTALLRRMPDCSGKVTAHGFRSSFRDWAGESTAHPREVIEAALSHRLKDKAEAAYARGDMLVKRRKLLEDWAIFLESPPAQQII